MGLSVCLIFYFIGMSYAKGTPIPWYFSSPGAGTIGMLVSLTVALLVSLFSKQPAK